MAVCWNDHRGGTAWFDEKEQRGSVPCRVKACGLIACPFLFWDNQKRVNAMGSTSHINGLASGGPRPTTKSVESLRRVLCQWSLRGGVNAPETSLSSRLMQGPVWRIAL